MASRERRAVSRAMTFEIIASGANELGPRSGAGSSARRILHVDDPQAG